MFTHARMPSVKTFRACMSFDQAQAAAQRIMAAHPQLRAQVRGQDGKPRGGHWIRLEFPALKRRFECGSERAIRQALEAWAVFLEEEQEKHG